MSLGLTPAGRLRWAHRDGDSLPPALAGLQPAFDADWRAALFTLAADRIDTRGAPAARFWQQIAERHLVALCHLPEHEQNVAVEPPAAADCAAWILAAPPMRGGEYLAEASLRAVWSHLDEWVRAAVSAAGGLAAFLRARAPSWHQVGRVCFHLAENRGDEDRPFAFLATYASGFGAAGRVRHLPLRRALEQYAGARNRAALVALLSPIQQAAETCGWVRELVDSGDVYQALAWTPERAYRLLRSVPALEASGLTVRLPNWWRKRPRPRVGVTIGDAAPSVVGADAMVDFDVRVALGDEPLSQAELDTLLAGDGDLVLLKGQWVEVRADARPAVPAPGGNGPGDAGGSGRGAGAASGRRRPGGDDVRHAAAAAVAGGRAVAPGRPGRSAGRQEPGDPPEPGRAQAAGPRPRRPDRHAGREPPGRPVGAVRLPQPRTARLAQRVQGFRELHGRDTRTSPGRSRPARRRRPRGCRPESPARFPVRPAGSRRRRTVASGTSRPTASRSRRPSRAASRRGG